MKNYQKVILSFLFFSAIVAIITTQIYNQVYWGY